MTTGQITLGIVGAVAGYFTGGAGWILMGAAVGFAVGTFVNPVASDMPSPGSPQTHELDVPTIEEGVPIADALGTTRSIGQIFWYGKERTKAIKEKVKSGGKGGGGKTKKVVVGYEYYLSWAQGIVLGPVDVLYTVLRDEEIIWAGVLECPESGGEETITLEGMGSMTFYFGTNDQTANSQIGAEVGSTTNPSYRGLCYAYFDDCFIGSYNRAPRIRFVYKKRPTFSFNVSESIGTYDYNPAHAMYYFLTNHNYVEFPTEWINDSSFSEFADVFLGEYEQHGLSMLISRQEPALRIMENVLTHAGAVMPYGIDGKFHLNALRAYEDISTLPSITQDDFAEPLVFERRGWQEVVNEVQVQHHERYTVDSGVLTVEEDFDPSDQFDYTGTPDPERWYLQFGSSISDTDGSNVPTIAVGGVSWSGELDSGSEYEQHRMNSSWFLVEDYSSEYVISTRVDFTTITSEGSNDTDYVDVFSFGFSDTHFSAISYAYVYTAIRLYRDNRITIYHKSKNNTSNEMEIDSSYFPLWIRVTRKVNLPTWIYFAFDFYYNGAWMNAHDGTEGSGSWSGSYESPRHLYPYYEFSTVPSGSGVTDVDVSCSAEPFNAEIASNSLARYDPGAYDDSWGASTLDSNKWTVVNEGESVYTTGGDLVIELNPLDETKRYARVDSNIILDGDFQVLCEVGVIDSERSDNQPQYARSAMVVRDTVNTGLGFAVGWTEEPGTYVPAPYTKHWEIVGDVWTSSNVVKRQFGRCDMYIKRVSGVISTRTCGGSPWIEHSGTYDNPMTLSYENMCDERGNKSSIDSNHEYITFSGDYQLVIHETPQQALNIRRSAVTADDRGTAEIHGRAVTKSVQLMMYGSKENAGWAADRAIRRAAYPFAEGKAIINRSAFKYEVGDLFKLSDSEHNISNMVCRVMDIGEGNLSKEDISITFMEEPDYMTSSATLAAVTTEGSRREYGLEPLTETDIMEAPYSLVGEEIVLLPLAGRKVGTEVGYEIYYSIDGGTSYSYLDDAVYYANHGSLVGSLNIEALTLEKELTFEVDASFDDDFSEIETITRTDMLNNGNLSLLGTEIINFETITPDSVTEGRYEISDLSRGRYDSIRQTWSAGEDFWHVGNTSLTLLRDTNFVKGATIYFKFVPYNAHFVGDIADATAFSYTIVGRAFAPYVVENLRASGKGRHATYGKDIYLTWSPRVRGADAGINNPDEVIDSSPTHEGYFEVAVKNGLGSTVRTATSLSAYYWEYSQAMNEADNGSLEDELTFQVDNYKSDTGVRYDNIHSRTLVVSRISSTTTTTTVTTTSTTVTSTTSTTV